MVGRPLAEVPCELRRGCPSQPLGDVRLHELERGRARAGAARPGLRRGDEARGGRALPGVAPLRGEQQRVALDSVRAGGRQERRLLQHNRGLEGRRRGHQHRAGAPRDPGVRQRSGRRQRDTRGGLDVQPAQAQVAGLQVEPLPRGQKDQEGLLLHNRTQW